MEQTPAAPAQPQPAQPPIIRMFPIAQIKASRFQARKVFDDSKLQGLAKSMKETGLQVSIGVQLMPDGSAELIFGERRLRAAKLLGCNYLKRFLKTTSTPKVPFSSRSATIETSGRTAYSIWMTCCCVEVTSVL